MKSKKWLKLCIFGIIVLLFSYFRLTIINSHNVAYTYDQGRDFLAGARIVTDKNLVFIGPTTGISGVFHGAWWYYTTALSFFVLGPNPISFYHMLLIIHLFTLALWFFVVQKVFGTVAATWSSILISSSSYFVGSHTFAGNNILAIPAFTLFCLMHALLLFYSKSPASISSKKILTLAGLLGMSAGFVAENELSFGIFLAPSLVLLTLVSKSFRGILAERNKIFVFFSGLLIPFLPRILFEAKNGFMQTKVLLSFFTKPKLYNPRSYTDVFFERISVFKSYIEQALGNTPMVLLALVVTIIAAYLFWKSRKDKSVRTDQKQGEIAFVSQFISNTAILLGGLFVFCLVYRDPFWANYYEGIQIGFLLLFIAITKYIQYQSKILHTVIVAAIILFIMPIFADRLMGTFTWKSSQTSGMILQESVVDYIVQKQKANNENIFCARVFTPPVIPHTYDYLWLYHYLMKEVETPRFEFVDNKCWYILEPEWKGYEFRLVEWKKNNIPPDAKLIEKETKMFGEISILRYQQ